MKERNLDRKATKVYIEREENDLKAYVKKYFDEDWTDARLYDLVIDMGKNSVEQAVDMICNNIKHMQQ